MYKRQGKKVFTNINIVNDNPTAVEIGEKELATLSRACGVSNLDDTEELHGIEIMVKIAIQPASSQYAASNVIKGYSPVEGLANPNAAKSDKNEKKGAKVSFDD